MSKRWRYVMAANVVLAGLVAGMNFYIGKPILGSMWSAVAIIHGLSLKNVIGKGAA